MLRPPSLIAPVTLLAAASLLCGCAAATGSKASTPSNQPRAGSASVAPAENPPIATPTLTAVAQLPVPTASTWADLLVGGTITTTAAAPSITGVSTTSRRVTALAPRADRSRPPVRTAKGKTVYLTFDDGPSAKYTPAILALLEEYDAKATFFVIGRQSKGARATLRAEYAAGHGVGNHTWDHRSLRRMKATTFKREVVSTQRAVKSATGHAPTCLRPPSGAIDKHTRARTKRLGLRLQFWTIDTADWKNPSSKVIARRVVNHVKDGSVVLLHDGGGKRAHTVSALRVILKDLDARGYRFAALCR